MPSLHLRHRPGDYYFSHTIVAQKVDQLRRSASVIDVRRYNECKSCSYIRRRMSYPRSGVVQLRVTVVAAIMIKEFDVWAIALKRRSPLVW
jgi:hypothetical protein